MTALGEAVRAGDTEAVRRLLDGGADPDGPDEDGLPPLCAAVAAYAYETAEALVEAGADPDRVLPDGTTPLLRAVESGSPAVVGELLWSGDSPEPWERLPEVGRLRLLDAARRWYEEGAQERLRRLMGETGPAETVTVTEEYCRVEQVTLGGRTVRAGHGAVLTTLEWLFDVPVSLEELVARAVRHTELHVDWSASTHRLGDRLAEGGREVVTALRYHPSPIHRRFAADWLLTRQWGLGVDAYPHHAEDRELLADWADAEADPEVLALVLWALTEHDVAHPRLGSLGLRYAAHPDPGVRLRAVDCMGRPDGGPFTAAEREALRRLAGDPEDEVRYEAALSLLSAQQDVEAMHGVIRDLVRDPGSPMRMAAAERLGESGDRTADATDLLLSLLDTDDTLTRLLGAYGLALRDHPDTPWAYERAEELGPFHRYDHRANGLWDWEKRNGAGRAGGTA
ncbi:HEAT repeat domain-containing protein [Streptomyces sp. NPDC051546]|uniref:HEAT repeat domain-containing protein n=1 Tax=Streptomyces sp. NPDC051546 TaxID=3365655 RepID=UPI00378A19B5